MYSKTINDEYILIVGIMCIVCGIFDRCNGKNIDLTTSVIIECTLFISLCACVHTYMHTSASATSTPPQPRPRNNELRCVLCVSVSLFTLIIGLMALSAITFFGGFSSTPSNFKTHIGTLLVLIIIMRAEVQNRIPTAVPS